VSALVRYRAASSVTLDRMKSPWKTMGALEPGAQYLVLASSIPPKRISSTWKLFRGSRAVRQQLLGTDGVMGFSMLAEPIRKRYATLSVWRDEASLSDFARAHPHDELVVALRPEMGETRFVRWTISGADGRPSWKEALERLT
jgi:hypothetical protein